MFKLGITGGIGSGKSTAANFFRHKGAMVFDADEESKKHLNSNIHLQKQIMDAFGSEYFIHDQFDLHQLGQIAFLNNNNQNILNNIMWPEVFILMKTASINAKKNGFNLFIVDAALILEAGHLDFFDSILLISALKSIRIKRIIERKNIPLEQIEKRMSLQMNNSKKKQIANSNIENNGDIQDFHDKLAFYHGNLKINE